MLRPIHAFLILTTGYSLGNSLLLSHAYAEPPLISGIYPHLAMYNDEGECGTGAVVPWANKLWVVTYAPHKPLGSSDKLYEITPKLELVIRPESVGGTPANRMIHQESQQLFIGPYTIDQQGKVRTIPYSQMYGRPTANARHLTDPQNKIYYATMEEGLYEVDVHSLAVKELWADEQRQTGRHANLPGYHGKGLYSAQQVVVYANNGEHGHEALTRPDIPSGVLAEWDGHSSDWKIVRRNQFTEVTGPGGILGNQDASDPVWSIGWDHRSLILMCRYQDAWHAYRLPKASHSYDGAHGWNTEWPRIRDIGEDDLLMTMHGMFWRFPKNFQPNHSQGILPRSSYLKVIGDFCRWNDRIVCGCDDTAKNEFLNKRRAKGTIAAPQSQSNLWFLNPGQLDQLGPVLARGGVWLNEPVPAHTPSEPFLVAGFTRKSLHLHQTSDATATIHLEADHLGNNTWTHIDTIQLPTNHPTWLDLSHLPPTTWLRLTSDRPLTQATAWFTLANPDRRPLQRDPMFAGLAEIQPASEQAITGGILRARGENKRTLHFVASTSANPNSPELGLYELDAQLQLQPVQDPAALQFQRSQAAIPTNILIEEPASILFIDDSDRRWRLPRGHKMASLHGPLGESRSCREVATERDLFQAGGTFFELPAENAGGFAKIRAITTHNCQIVDFCSYRGLFIMSGLHAAPPVNNPHIILSQDQRTALWVGAIDDIWRMGKPHGVGGPWLNSPVQAKLPSDPYLMNGYDHKSLQLSHTSNREVSIRVECDVTGSGHWLHYQSFAIPPAQTIHHTFPDAFAPYWLRVIAEEDCVATAQLHYE